jgi:glucose-1-phosphate thymidylyltransferase
MNRGFAWLDAGTHESLFNATQFVEVVESRQGIKIGCIEEVAFHRGFISLEQLKNLSNNFKSNNSYGKYLKKIIKYASN